MFLDELHLRDTGRLYRNRAVFELTQEFRCMVYPGFMVTVPAGFKTDFASIHPVFWWLVRPTGKHRWGAVVHDWLVNRRAQCPRVIADAVYYCAMEHLGVSWWRRLIIWWGLRAFGWMHYPAEGDYGIK